jgi:hypothetical protein
MLSMSQVKILDHWWHCNSTLQKSNLVIYNLKLPKYNYIIYNLLQVDCKFVKSVHISATKLSNHLITVRPIHDTDSEPYGKERLIPRIYFTHFWSHYYDDSIQLHPDMLLHTFSSRQGLNLETINVNLTYPLFSHGLLCTALSRIHNHYNTIVCLCPGLHTSTNVTYSEVAGVDNYSFMISSLIIFKLKIKIPTLSYYLHFVLHYCLLEKSRVLVLMTCLKI